MQAAGIENFCWIVNSQPYSGQVAGFDGEQVPAFRASASLALSWGLQRLIGDWHPLLAALAWFAVAWVIWLANHFLVERSYPMFTVPAQWIWPTGARKA